MWLNLYLITTLASGIINVSKSMYIKKRMEYNNDEVIRKFNKLSTKAKIMSNIKNIFITLCPVVNIIHSIKNLRTSNDSLYSKWKKDTLESYFYLDKNLDDEPVVEPTETVQETRTPDTTNDREIPPLPARRQSTPKRTNGTTPLPARRPATENDEYVIEPEVRRPSRPVSHQQQARRAASAQSNPKMSPLDYLRSEYNKEKRIYDMMVMNNASKEEIKQQVLKVNAIVEKYKDIKSKSEKVSGPKLTLK